MAIDGRYECALCGAIVDVQGTDDQFVVADIWSDSRIIHTVSYGRVELHRCERDAPGTGGPPTDATP